MKVGVIGVGSMGRNHARIYSDMKGVDAVWAWDPSDDACRYVNERYDVRIADDMDTLLSYVDMVSICSPTIYHLEQARAAIGSKVPCLVEKPMAATIEDARALAHLADESGAAVYIGHVERFNPVLDAMCKLIAKPVYVSVRRHNPDSSRLAKADIISDLMVHDLDILCNKLLVDEMKLVGAVSAHDGDVCDAIFRCGQAAVSLSASRVSADKVRSVTVQEPGCTIVGDYMRQEVSVYKRPMNIAIGAGYRQENIVERIMVGKKEPLREELLCFRDSVASGKPLFPVQCQDALPVMELVSQVQHVMRVDSIFNEVGP